MLVNKLDYELDNADILGDVISLKVNANLVFKAKSFGELEVMLNTFKNMDIDNIVPDWD